MHWFKKYYLIFTLLVLVLAFYYRFIQKGLLPVPADTIVGMYHPYRDKIWNNYTSGVPFKNPLITDPVRQQFVWRTLALKEIKQGSLPVWNPYSFSGTLLLANFQSAAFYPLNLLFFIMPGYLAWTLEIIISHILLAVFLYLYLKNIGFKAVPSLFGSFAFSFSGFVISWLTWNTIDHVVAWIIFSLYSVDKILNAEGGLKKDNGIWYLWLIVSQVFAFLAGHLQIFFYGELLVLVYFLFRFYFYKKLKPVVFIRLILCFLVFILVTLPQSLPAFKFITESSRDLDQGAWTKPGWFIPPQNLSQFIAPDYFGNPVTGNYFGIWNYAEFVGFIGLAPLVFALFSVFFVKRRLNYFYLFVLIVCLLFAFPTPLAKLPFILNIPLISTSQPTRLLFLIDLSLAVLAASGLEYFLETHNKKDIFKILYLIGGILLALYIFSPSPVSVRNLILPVITMLLITVILFFIVNPGFFQNKVYLVKNLKYFLFLIVFMELFRFGWKFTPFTPKEWLFPDTGILTLLKNDKSLFRIMTLDRRIMPPNFAAAYNIQDVAGYDPLYFRQYGLLVSSWNSGVSQAKPGSFNRIVTPDNWNSRVTDLLNVKYFLSLSPLNSPGLNLVKQEGNTYLYENSRFLPRAWFVDSLKKTINQSEELSGIISGNIDLANIALSSENIDISLTPGVEKEKMEDFLEINYWSENRIIIKTGSQKNKLLVLSEIYHPVWKAKVDGNIAKVFKVDYLLRGIPLKVGNHTIEFYTELL